MKKFRIIFISILVILSIVIYAKVKPSTSQPTNNIIIPTITPKITKESKTFLVAVSKFKNIKTDYTFKQLKAEKLFSLTANQSIIPAGLNVEFVNTKKISTYLEKNYIGLLTPSQVKPWYKTLLINGQNIWSKSFNADKYKLFSTATITLSNPNQEIQLSNVDKLAKTTIFASGEIIPARAVDRLGFNVFNNYTYVYDFLKSDIKQADLAVAMLENSLLGNPVPCTGCTTFVGDDQAAKGIAQAGFDIISTAGNHSGDGGQLAYPNTIELFHNLDILTTGTGKTDEENIKPAIKKINGKRIGIIGADDIGYFYWHRIMADGRYGANSFSKLSGTATVVDYDAVAKLSKIKKQNKIDFLIVFMSWGIEYTNKPTSHQQELAHAFIDNGVDLVLGSHPHWVQAIEFYKDKPIVYSMGNFIFDQSHTLETRQDMVTKYYFYQNELKSIELIPLQYCGYHQTNNNLTQKYLNKEISLEEVYETDDNQGCVFWQPKKLKESHPAYQQILQRVFEYS